MMPPRISLFVTEKLIFSHFSNCWALSVKKDFILEVQVGFCGAFFILFWNRLKNVYIVLVIIIIYMSILEFLFPVAPWAKEELWVTLICFVSEFLRTFSPVKCSRKSLLKNPCVFTDVTSTRHSFSTLLT